MVYKDRAEAGKLLATKLTAYFNQPDVLILGLPRGGVPVAFEVAKALHASLDVFLVRKLGVPDQKELAMGAIASGGVRVLNQDIVESLNITEDAINTVATSEQQELERREYAYRDNRPPVDVRDRIVILVDDGIATGATMRAAIAAIKPQQPKRLVIAVPVASPETCKQFKAEVDEIICANTPERFQAVGLWYKDFSQTTDEQVRDLLKQSGQQELTASSQ